MRQTGVVSGLQAKAQVVFQSVGGQVRQTGVVSGLQAKAQVIFWPAARTLLQPTAPNLQHTANQQRNDQFGNQHHSRELLMMDIVIPEICRAYKKYNKIIRGIQLVFYSSVILVHVLFIFFNFCPYLYFHFSLRSVSGHNDRRSRSRTPTTV